MEKENGVYADFYAVKDGLTFPIKTLNLREVSKILTECMIGGLESIIRTKKRD